MLFNFESEKDKAFVESIRVPVMSEIDPGDAAETFTQLFSTFERVKLAMCSHKFNGG